MTNYCSWCHQADEPLSLPAQPPALTISKSPLCPQCHRPVTLVTIGRACEIVSKSKRTIYQWMENGLISTVRTSGGAPLICFSSLFTPSEKEFGEYMQEKRD